MFEEKDNTAEGWIAERKSLLQKKISELGLKLEGTRLEKLVERLYEELEKKGIKFKPKVYLSDEWGCPDAVPIIGIPFYLVDERLSRIEDEIMEGIEAESEKEILEYLRHETGHAFNYSYKLYETEEWHNIFGPYSRPYRDDYEPIPFSRNFVLHIAGWYAQKHPDEDFAETFAVWMTPDSNWKETYEGWGCYKKLLYVDKVVNQFGASAPLVTAEDYDVADELNGTIGEHYEKYHEEPIDVPAYFDGDLKDIFERKVPAGKEEEWPTAHQFLMNHRRELIRNINYWTGLNESMVKSLIHHFTERCKLLDLYVNPDRSYKTLMEMTTYATTLSMNKLYKGDFVIK